MFAFLSDLDDYFAETYSDYDRVCVLPGYSMPQMQAVKRLDDGRDFAYTLPASTMAISNQKEKDKILSELKKTLSDGTVSFSFRPLSLWERGKNRRNKQAFYKILPRILLSYGVKKEEIGDKLPIEKEIWEKILKGKFLPTKNLLFSLALLFSFSFEDTESLLLSCGRAFDFSIPKDVVVSYLLKNKVANREMIDAALAEYRVSNLFLP